MDTARVLQEDHGPRRRRRTRWPAALVLAALAAPLGSGSALALGGGSSSGSAATPAPAVSKPYMHYGGPGHCHHGDGSMGFRSSSRQL